MVVSQLTGVLIGVIVGYILGLCFSAKVHIHTIITENDPEKIKKYLEKRGSISVNNNTNNN